MQRWSCDVVKCNFVLFCLHIHLHAVVDKTVEFEVQHKVLVSCNNPGSRGLARGVSSFVKVRFQGSSHTKIAQRTVTSDLGILHA